MRIQICTFLSYLNGSWVMTLFSIFITQKIRSIIEACATFSWLKMGVILTLVMLLPKILIYFSFTFIGLDKHTSLLQNPYKNP